MLDEDGSGDIAYTEFVEQVVKMSALAEPTQPPPDSGDSGMYPDPNVPRHGKSLYKPYIVDIYGF